VPDVAAVLLMSAIISTAAGVATGAVVVPAFGVEVAVVFVVVVVVPNVFLLIVSAVLQSVSFPASPAGLLSAAARGNVDKVVAVGGLEIDAVIGIVSGESRIVRLSWVASKELIGCCSVVCVEVVFLPKGSGIHCRYWREKEWEKA
jgi:hypothetical protein